MQALDMAKPSKVGEMLGVFALTFGVESLFEYIRLVTFSHNGKLQ